MALRCVAGSSQYAILESSVPDANSDYTICGWIYFDAVTGYIFGSKGSGGTAYDGLEIIYFSSDGQPTLYCDDNTGASAVSDNLDNTVSTGQWYHFAIVREGEEARAYRDGVLEATVTMDVSGGLRGATQDWRLAASWDGAQYCSARYHGWKIWSRALTPAELQREKRTAMPGSFAGINGIWPFIAGQRTADFSGKGRTWSEVNSPTDADGPPIAWNTHGGPVIEEATGISGNTGAGDSVIAAPTSSGSGELSIAGTGTSSVAAPASSGSGALAIAGAGTSSIAAPTTEGSGALAITGTGNGVIAAPVSEGAGSEGDLTGTGDSVIAAPTSEGAGALSITGTGDGVIAAPTSSGSGTGFGEALAVVTWGQFSSTVSLSPGDEVRFALSAVAASITLDNVKVRIVVFAQRSGVPIVLREPKRMRPPG